MKRILILFLLFGQAHLPAMDKTRVVQIGYFNKIFGHIHRNASRYSQSLTTIACNHPVKVLAKVSGKKEELIFSDKWHFVKVGPYRGYINKDYVSSSKVDCFQDRFPRFFDQMEVDITESYYWGRLNDLYIQGKSKLR